MAARQKVHIVGGGISGMVAAICLAREGHEVTVLERAKSIGGLHPLHPSNHSTPVNVDLIKDYVGLDISPCLMPQTNMYIYAHGRKYSVPWVCYSVERGPRKTSLDTFLYEKALEHGVRFQFGQTVTRPEELPHPTILASGLFPEMYKALGRPMARLPCFSAIRKVTDPDRQGEIRTWLGPYTNTYAYAPINNGLDYILLFSDRDLPRSNLERFEEDLYRSEQIRVQKWESFEVYVPVCRADAPRLFHGKKILAGTLAGMMEPGAYFGIHGALISGRIAARAVTDPEGAAQDFRRFNRGYRQSWYTNRLMPSAQKRFVFRLFFRFPALFSPFLRLTDTGIPGIDHFMTQMKPRCVGSY